MELYKKRRIDAHIDMTPMVDTLLQLFLIFLLGASVISSTMNIDLPEAGTKKKSPTVAMQDIIVSLDGSKMIRLNKRPVPLNNLETELHSLVKNSKDATVRLLADRKLPYEDVLAVMIEIQNAGPAKMLLAYTPGEAGRTVR